MNKPKIAVIGLKGLPAFGGAASVGENIIQQLKDEYDFTVYATSLHTNRKTGDMNGYKQIVFRNIPFKKLNTLYYYLVSACHAILFRKYDLIHLHHRDAAFITIFLKIKYKVVITTHGSFYLLDKWNKFRWVFQINERWFVKKANVVTNVSLEEKRQYKKIINLDTIYIPNGVNIPNEFEQDNFEEKFKPYLFFGAGRIIKSKGLDVLLKALHLLNFTHTLLVAGDIDQTPEYKKEILQLATGLNVQFLGLIKDKKRLLSLIHGAKLFLFPSSLEAMSMMLLEAVSCKTPLIASDIEANTDIFNENELLFFKNEDEKDLAVKIDFAIKHYDQMIEMADTALKKVKNAYNWEYIATKYKEIFEFLLES